MKWTKHKHPKDFDELSPQVRDKAIEIGNEMLQNGNAEKDVIPVAIETAKDWITYSAPAHIQ